MTANSIITSRIGVPFVAEIEGHMPIIGNGNKQFDKNFTGGTGTTIDIILPGYGVVNTGADMSSLDMGYIAAKKSVTLLQRGLGVSLTTVEQQLALSSFNDQIAKPYGIQMANVHEKLAADTILLQADTATVINTGTAGYTNIGDSVSVIRSAYSSGDLFGVMSNQLMSQVLSSGLTLFNPSKSITDSFLNGGIGKYRGADWYESPNVAPLLTGTHAVSTAANLRGALNAGGTVLTLTMTSGTLTGTFAKGEIITLAGVKAVDIYGVAMTQDYAFVVQTLATAGSDTVAIDVKQVYIDTPNKNISPAAMPTVAVLATIQTVASSTYLRGFAWDKQSFVFASAKLAPMAMSKSMSTEGEFMAVTVQQGTDFIKGIDIVRWDVLTGFLLARSNWVSSILVKI